MPRTFDTRTDPDAAIDAAVATIRAGECIVLPTDTVYGIGADAFSASAVAGLLEAKGRGRQSPPPVLIPALTTLDALAETVPLSRTMSEELQRLRNWVKGRARLASGPVQEVVTDVRRKIEI